ncbi:T9SS type B sorting domain-containing protein [Flavobacterium sp. xlx-214]|nr:T9SS type B sorting domain-containing protein [Flavobacterium sp. xlx-214]
MMKNTFLKRISNFSLLFLLVCSTGYSQQYSYVKVDDTYTPERLVKEVLVNSSCDLVSNVKYQNGDGSPATRDFYTLGYVQKNTSSFPFDRAILLGTGDPKFTPGPANGPIGPGNAHRWTGDKDLNDAINDAGGWPNQSDMRSTTLEFDFIPVQSTVNFEYLFASNSWSSGCTWRCENGAMFAAWLIDTTTGVGENLAKLPGTNTPISINTVSDLNKSHSVNGTLCRTINPEFFDNYYGTAANQVPPLSAPINFIGHTVPMVSRIANVVPGRKYRIKLAVMDFCPNAAHTSAAYFKAGSFDIGNLDLGNPILIDDGKGLCVGDSHTLKSGMDPNLFTFEWFKDGIKIPGQTGANLVVTETGDYHVRALIPNVAGCVMESAPVRIEFYNYVRINAPQNLQLCPTKGLTTRFDLKDAVVGTTTNPNILFKFYTNKKDAEDDKNSISDLYDLANNAAVPVTLWVRAYELNNPCPYIASFTLSFVNCTLYLNQLPNLTLCEGDTVQTFDLTVQTPVVYNNAAGYTVTYHISKVDADAGQGAIPVGNLSTYNGTHGERIWVRVTNDTNAQAYGVTSFYLFRYRLPLTQATILPLTSCEINSSGLATFDLNMAYNLIPLTSVGVSLEYYTNQQDAILGNTALMLPANYTGPAGTIYVRVRNLDGDCFKVVPLQLQIVNTPTANALAPLTYCDLNNDGFGEFNLDATRVLIAGNPMPQNAVVTFHETQGEADANANAIGNTGAYINKVKDQQTIYVRVGFTNSSCYNTVPLLLKVNKTPPINPIGKIVVCDVNNDAVEVVNLTSKEAELLQGLNATNYTVTYHISISAAMSGTGAIGNPTSFSTSVSKVIYVRVVDKTTGCFAVTRVELELASMPTIANPLPTAYMCDTDGNGFEVFDLASMRASIVGIQQGLSVSFHYTNSDAQSGVSPLPNQYQNVSPNVQTIYVRVFNATTGCFVVSTLKLEVKANPVINVPTTPYVICSDSGFGRINLYLYGKDLVDATGHNYGFQFFETQSDAENNVGFIGNPVAYDNLKPGNPTVWIRVEDPVSRCFSVYPISFQLVIPPKIPATLPKLVECDVLGNTQDQSTLFDLTQQDAALLAAQSVQGTYQIRYFTTKALADSNTNWIVTPKQYQNSSNPETIWVRIEDTSKPGGCSRVMSFEIEVVAPLVLHQPLPIVMCDTGLPNDGQREIDLTIRERDILGGQIFGAVVTYHLTKQDAEKGWSKIQNPKQFYNTVNPQTIYVSVVNQYGCRSVITLTVRVLPLPEPNMTPLPLEMCENAFGSGFATFDLTKAEPNLSNFAHYDYSYFVDAVGAQTNTGAIATKDNYLSNSSTVYVRVVNSFTDTDQQCVVVVPLELIVNPWPTVGPMTPLAACMDTPAPTTTFNLHDKDAEALGAQQAAADFIVTYHASQLDAEGGVKPLPYTYTNTTVTQQRIWVRVENKKTKCFNVGDFLLQIEQNVYAFRPDDAEFCETDYVNDGISLVDLTTLDVQVIRTQPQTGLLVRYERYNGDKIPDPATSVQVRNGETLRAVVYNNDPTIVCTANVEFVVHIKDAPEVKPLVDGIICYESRDGDQLIKGHTLDTGIPLNVAYTFDWTYNGGAVTPNVADLVDGGRKLFAKAPGTYSVTVTGTNGCTTTRSAVVQQAASITIDEVKLTDSFGGANAIEVLAYAGAGIELEYRLDNGPWQDNNIFLDVTPGEHIVYVRTKVGLSCEASKVITTMDYPKFFTPNNDGHNDTWNIWALKNQPKAKIYIFDRFGKLIKQISPAGEGWDGTFNGKPMPSTDYWFKAEYIDPKTGLQKEVQGHFSLKR